MQELDAVFPRGEDITVGSTVVFGVEPLERDATYEWEVIESPVRENDTPETATERLLQHDERDNRVTTFRPAHPTDGTPYKIEVTARVDGEIEGTKQFEIEAVAGELENTDKTKLDLVEEYAPVLHFHENEDYYPTRYEAYIDNSYIHRTDVEPGNPALEVPEDDPTLIDIGGEYVDDIYVVFTGLSDAELRDVQEAYPPTVYASVHADVPYTHDEFEDYDVDFVAITYWMFYLNDPKTGGSGHVLSHTSDLETVTVLIEEESLIEGESPNPRWVGAAQHKAGTVNRGYRTTGDNGRIHVYPARDAHSSYLTNHDVYDTFPTELREDYGAFPIPIQTRFVLPSTGSTVLLPVGGDETGNAQRWVPDPNDEFAPEQDEDTESYQILLLTGDEHWADFEGILNGDVGVIPGGKVPMQRDRWADPGSWIDDLLVPFEAQLDGTIQATKPEIVDNDVWIDATVTNEGLVHHEFVVRAAAYPSDPDEETDVLRRLTLSLPSRIDFHHGQPGAIVIVRTFHP